MNLTGGSFSSIEQAAGRINHQPAGKPNGANVKPEVSFGEVFGRAQVRFSKHANERLAMRNIELDDSQIERLEDGMNMAREKGLKDPLVMVDNIAFIVNVKSNTVVTAVKNAGNSVFTNIDGAVIS